jgi:hypothetical protein
MEIFQEITAEMLEPSPWDRVKFCQLYNLIEKNKSVLFKNLENDQIVKDFDKYYSIEKRLNEKNEKIEKKLIIKEVIGKETTKKRSEEHTSELQSPR